MPETKAESRWDGTQWTFQYYLPGMMNLFALGGDDLLYVIQSATSAGYFESLNGPTGPLGGPSRSILGVWGQGPQEVFVLTAESGVVRYF
jgi:hypothetical protein